MAAEGEVDAVGGVEGDVNVDVDVEEAVAGHARTAPGKMGSQKQEQRRRGLRLQKEEWEERRKRRRRWERRGRGRWSRMEDMMLG